MKDIKSMIAIMQAFAEGKKIETKHESRKDWESCSKPSWDWIHWDYRIKPEPKYRPYKNAEECFADVQKHGGWVKNKKENIYWEILMVQNNRVRFISGDMELMSLFENKVWADDGTPCGVLKEEEYKKRNNRTLPW